MSKKRIFTLFYKDITLFFAGRRKIRKKAEILYFITLFFVSFFMALLYKKMKVETVTFALSFTFFLYLLMSFIFELKHFIFFEEDMKIVKRLPVQEKEYYISKGMLLGLFGLIFTSIVTIGNFLGAVLLVNKTIPVIYLFWVLLFNTFFSIGFSMFVYASLLKVFRKSDAGDLVAKIQVSLGVLFGLVFALSPNLAPLLDAIDAGTLSSTWYFKLLPFAWFQSLHKGFIPILVSVIYVLFPLLLGVLMGFDETESRSREPVTTGIKLPLIRNRKKLAVYTLVLTHILRSKITKRTLIAPVIINVVVLLMWSFSKDIMNVVFFGVWTLAFMSVITSLVLFISDSYRASWMLFKAPLLNGDVVATGIDAGFIFVIVPYAVFLSVLFIFKGLSIRFLLIPIFYGLVVSYLFVNLIFLSRPSMLFSRAGFERGINSIKELILSFVFVPLFAAGFNVFYKFKLFCAMKLSILVILAAGYYLNYRISRKYFKMVK